MCCILLLLYVLNTATSLCVEYCYFFMCWILLLLYVLNTATSLCVEYCYFFMCWILLLLYVLTHTWWSQQAWQWAGIRLWGPHFFVVNIKVCQTRLTLNPYNKQTSFIWLFQISIFDLLLINCMYFGCQCHWQIHFNDCRTVWVTSMMVHLNDGFCSHL